jgi:uridine kinase
MPYLIGVAGGTGSGKSTIARALVDRIGGCVIDADSYYVDRSAVPAAERRLCNYDEPAAIDDSLLIEHLTRLARGEAVARPVYSFATHTRVGVTPVLPAKVIVVEGLFTLWWEKLRALLNLKVFVDAPADLRLARRLKRDLMERGRTVDQVLQQYLLAVRPMHDRYVEPSRVHADWVVLNDGSIEGIADEVAAPVRALASRWGRAETAGAVRI